jgi:hypothetical protein
VGVEGGAYNAEQIQALHLKMGLAFRGWIHIRNKLVVKILKATSSQKKTDCQNFIGNPAVF